MREGVRILLNHGETSHRVTSAPDGMFELDYSLARSEKYYGMMPKYSGRLGFVKDSKTFIDAIKDTSRYSNIEFQCKLRNKQTLIYNDFLTGVINLVNHTQEKNKTFVDFEGDEIEMKFNSRHEIEIPYNRMTSFNGTALPGFTYDYKSLRLQGVGTSKTVESIHPHEAFSSVLQQILDLSYPCLYAPIFGRTEILSPENENTYYSEDGELSKKMLFKGTWGRGIDDDLTFSLASLFEFYNKLMPLGLGFAEDYQGRTIIVIDKRENFFYEQTTLELDRNKISDLRCEFGREFQHTEYEVGPAKKVKDGVAYGKSEYNVKTNYSNLNIMGGEKVDLTNVVRTDSVAINDLITNYTNSSEECEYDEDIFLVDAMDVEGETWDMTNYKTENYDSVSGIEDNPGLYYNLDFSPGRIIEKYFGSWFNIGLQDLDGAIKYNKAETLSKLATLRLNDTATLEEKEDILISILETPIMTGNVITCNYPLKPEDLTAIKESPLGQISFYNYLTKEWDAFWVKEVNTKVTSEKTTFVGYQCSTLARELELLLNEDGSYMLNENGTFIYLEK